MVSYLGVVRTILMADTAQFHSAIKGASDEFRLRALGMRHQAQALVGIGGALNMAITIPALLASRAIIRTGQDYEATMMKIRHVSRMSTMAMKDFEEQQRKLALNIGVKRTDLGKAAYLAAQAQISDPRAIAKFSEAVGKAERVLPGDAPLETVAFGFRSIIKAFKLETQDFMPTMGQMIRTIDEAVMTWEEYANTVTKVVAISSSLGDKQSLMSMNMALALMTQMGASSGQEAATALRGIYTRIFTENTKKKSPMNRLAKQLGYIDVADMFKRGAKSDPLAFMQMFPKNAKGKVEADELAKYNFRKREITAALGLANVPASRIEEVQIKFNNALENLNSRYEDSKDIMKNIIKDLSAAWEDLKIEFAKTLAPFFKQLFKNITAFIRFLSDLAPIQKKIIALVAALGVLSSALIAITGVIKSITLSYRLQQMMVGQGVVANVASAGGHMAGVAGVGAATVLRGGGKAVTNQILLSRAAYINRGVNAMRKGGGVTKEGISSLLLGANAVASLGNRNKGKDGAIAYAKALDKLNKQRQAIGMRPYTDRAFTTMVGGNVVANGAQAVRGATQTVAQRGASSPVASALGGFFSVKGFSIGGALKSLFTWIGRIYTAIKPFLKLLGKLAAQFYIASVVLRAVWDLLVINIIPALKTIGDALGSIGLNMANVAKFFEFIDKWILRSLSALFQTLAGLGENFFGVLANGVMQFVHSLKMLWGVITFDKSLILDAKEDIKNDQEQGRKNLKGLVNPWGKDSAARKNAEKLSEKWYGDKALTKEEEFEWRKQRHARRMEILRRDKAREAAEKAAQEMEEQIGTMFNRGGSSGFLEAGTSEAYEAMRSSENALITMLTGFRESMEQKLKELIESNNTGNSSLANIDKSLLEAVG